MKALDAASTAIVRVLEATAVIVLGVILVINTLEICARTGFDTSFQWIYEVNLLLACWLYFLGIVPVYARGGDITLLGYERLMHGRSREIYRAIIEVVTALTFAVIAWYAWTLIELQLPFRTPGMRIPNALFTAPVLIGLIGLTVVSLRRALGVLRA